MNMSVSYDPINKHTSWVFTISACIWKVPSANFGLETYWPNVFMICLYSTPYGAMIIVCHHFFWDYFQIIIHTHSPWRFDGRRRRGIVSPASYLGTTCFKRQFRDRLFSGWFLWFSSAPHLKTLKQHIKLGPERFLQFPFEFIIKIISLTLTLLATENVVKWTVNQSIQVSFHITTKAVGIPSLYCGVLRQFEKKNECL
jgi:hypothetical protein